jgi:hypothetical protein
VPFGFTLPETVAVVGPTLVTGPVVAVGAAAPAADAEDSRATVATATPVASSFDMMCGDNSNEAGCARLAHAILRSLYNAPRRPLLDLVELGLVATCPSQRYQESGE